MPKQQLDDTEIYELRLYDVAHGRLADEVSRMYGVAVDGGGGAAGEEHASMFDRYGIPRPLGAWTSITGNRQPQFGYLLRWNSLAERDAAFPSFWADPEWQAIRNATDDSSAIIERMEDWLMRPSPSWKMAAAAGTRSTAPGDLTEMLIQRVETGHVPDAAAANVDQLLPFLRAQGAAFLGAFDVVIGPDMQAMITFLTWPDQPTHEAGWRAVDDDPALRQAVKNQRKTFGRPLVKSTEHQLLKPVHFATPIAMFGRDAK